MIVDNIQYSIELSTLTMSVFISKGEATKIIADVCLDRDIDDEEDEDYLMNLAIEVASDLGYRVEA